MLFEYFKAVFGIIATIAFSVIFLVRCVPFAPGFAPIFVLTFVAAHVAEFTVAVPCESFAALSAG